MCLPCRIHEKCEIFQCAFISPKMSRIAYMEHAVESRDIDITHTHSPHLFITLSLSLSRSLSLSLPHTRTHTHTHTNTHTHTHRYLAKQWSDWLKAQQQQAVLRSSSRAQRPVLAGAVGTPAKKHWDFNRGADSSVYRRRIDNDVSYADWLE